MSEPETKEIDSEPTVMRSVGGVDLTHVPKRWTKNPPSHLPRDKLRAFFASDLELCLVVDSGELVIELRRVKR